jgi:hypothetical protein
MKGVIVLAVVIGGIGLVVNLFFSREMTRDRGVDLAIAWVSLGPDNVEMQIGVGPMVPLRDPPEINPNTGAALWDAWEKAHYQVRDENGTEVRLRRVGTSAMFLDSKAAGNPEFILTASLRKGGKYTCDHVPVLAEQKRYRYSFTVPPETQKVGRELFQFVEAE